jgi:hypothetical protein
LAIPVQAFEGIFREDLARELTQMVKVRLIVYDPEQE